VLGAWQEGGGYIGEAVENGGVFFDTGGDEVWEMLKASDENMLWKVNEAFLREQLEQGIGRIDFNGDVNAVLRKFAGIADKDVPYRVRELRWLIENAHNYGYVKVGNNWLLKSSP